ncbi:hypothetical protein [Anaerolinea thermolimosa]|uniref:hypothetical protein n=1 Tax=Anaerolinea thermolimosa TaxID=229919 RepID=UPI0007815E92|nr:hypothetical protein [Anaerolinea thermolimosa]
MDRLTRDRNFSSGQFVNGIFSGNIGVSLSNSKDIARITGDTTESGENGRINVLMKARIKTA